MEAIAPPTDEDLIVALERACDTALEDLVEPGGWHVEGFVDEDGAIIARVDVPTGSEIDEALLEVFFDLFYYLPLDQSRSLRYRFEWVSHSNADLTEPAHHSVLETDIAMLPDTGGSTQEAWEAFVNQLHFSRDGQPQYLPTPEFIGDEES